MAKKQERREDFRKSPQERQGTEAPKKDIFDRMMSLPGLRIFEPFYKKFKEVLLYLLFGGLTTLISLVTYWYFCRIGVDALISNVISWAVSVLFAYVTNSIWVFQARPRNMQERLSQIAGFYGGRVATLLMEEVILFIGIRLLKQNEMVMKIICQILVLVGNYIISKFLVFRKKDDSGQ